MLNVCIGDRATAPDDRGKRLEAELAWHPWVVFLMPDLGEFRVREPGEVATLGAEDLLAGHGHRPAGRRSPSRSNMLVQVMVQRPGTPSDMTTSMAKHGSQ